MIYIVFMIFNHIHCILDQFNNTLAIHKYQVPLELPKASLVPDPRVGPICQESVWVFTNNLPQTTETTVTYYVGHLARPWIIQETKNLMTPTRLYKDISTMMAN